MSPDTEHAGPLGFLAIAGLLKDLLQRRATGVLLCERGEARKRVYFKNGIVIYASSNVAQDRLGDVLLAQGLITGAQFEESLRLIDSARKKHGTVLVQMGALSPKDLFNGLNLQVRTIIHSLFEWDDGRWSFTGDLPPQEEIVNLRIQSAPLIFEGVRSRAAGTNRFAEEWKPGSLEISPRKDPPWALEDLRLPSEAGKLLGLVERKTPWDKIPGLLGMGESDAAALLYTLSILELVGTRGAAGEAAPPPAPPPAAGERPRDQAFPPPGKIADLAARIPRLNLYQVLRLEPNAKSDSIKSAYIALAKEYHPDRFFDSAYEGLQDQITSIFMKINEAYSTLLNPAKRAEYDRREIRLETSQTPREDADKDSHIAREQYRKGMESLRAGDAWTAVESLRWAVQLNPRVALYHSWLGAALTRTKKRLHEAEEHCKTAIALDYSNPLYYVHLGQVYKTGKLTQKARKQFETALKLKPGFPEAVEELASVGEDGQEKGFMGKILGG